MPPATKEERIREEAVFRTEVKAALENITGSLIERKEASEKQWIEITVLGKKVAVLEAGGARSGGLAGSLTGAGSGGIAGILGWKLMQVLFGG